jgi:hypothetical protein
MRPADLHYQQQRSVQGLSPGLNSEACQPASSMFHLFTVTTSNQQLWMRFYLRTQAADVRYRREYSENGGRNAR